jgi:hypothetical protein
MTLPVWPGTLPQAPMREGYSVDQENPKVSTQMEDGPDVDRLRKLYLRTSISAKYLMTPAQATTFKAFWKVDLNRGVSDFTIPVWTMEAAGYVNKTARIEGAPKWEYIGPSHSAVMLNIKVRDF